MSDYAAIAKIVRARGEDVGKGFFELHATSAFGMFSFFLMPDGFNCFFANDMTPTSINVDLQKNDTALLRMLEAHGYKLEVTA